MGITGKIKGIINDSMWSSAGLMLMNVVMQFLVYPFWNSALGSEMYGNVIFLISLMNIFSISMGVSCNYCRMTNSAKGETYNSDYLMIMAVSSVIAAVYSLIVGLFCGVELSATDLLLYMLLSVFTMWRYYADVQYKLRVDYRSYFVYYLFISIGYAVGILLFKITGAWALALLPGEIAGLLYVFIRGDVLKFREKLDIDRFKTIVKMAGVLFFSEAVANIIFNGDRILLKAAMSGTAVAVYYQASLIGKTMSLITTPLNGVLIGYLVRFKGKFTKKLLGIITLASVGVILLALVLSVVGSYILIYILYPDDFDTVKQWFWLGNAPQIVFFISNIISVILLRISDAKFQMYLNIIYAVAFCLFCIPMTFYYGFMGFCIALLLTSTVRYASAVLLCFYSSNKKHTNSE